MYQLQVHEDTVYPWSPNESLSVLQVRRPWGGHLHLRMTFFLEDERDTYLCFL